MLPPQRHQPPPTHGGRGDTVILDYARRSAANHGDRRKGTVIDIDLHLPVRLRTDDLLLLEDGTLWKWWRRPSR